MNVGPFSGTEIGKHVGKSLQVYDALMGYC